MDFVIGLVAWIPFAALAAVSMLGFREVAAMSQWKHYPRQHYALCYFGMVTLGCFVLSFIGKTWTHGPW
jgi:MFS superfamily sulfate permease-like transporter